MANLETLHKTRQRIGKKRQPRHATKLAEFDSAIHSRGFSSPYDFETVGRSFFAALNAIPEFNQGSLGKTVNIGSEYLYRIVNIYDIASMFSVYWKFDNNGLNPSAFNDKSVFCNRFLDLEDIRDLTDWIPLGRCIKTFDFAEMKPVYYRNKRNFSFWTDSLLISEDTLENTFKLGFPSDRLEECAIILRCKVESLNEANLIYIPTVLDGFDQPIFLPIRENCSRINNGIAINIQPNPLQTGFREYVIGKIETDNIEFLPICINDLNVRGIRFMHNQNLIDKLEHYYNKL